MYTVTETQARPQATAEHLEIKEGDMMKKHPQPLTPAALYARVSGDRQDADLSVAAQLRALKEYALANGCSVAREDEAESGRVADRPRFREMIKEGSKPQAAFAVILVWKFSRFTRKREHAVAFKAQRRRKGVRAASILEQAEEIARCIADFRDFLKEGAIPEKKALIRNFVEAIEVEGDEATLTYAAPMSRDGVKRESASVLDFVQYRPPEQPCFRHVYRVPAFRH